jgi:hypothetical protein
VLAQAFQPAAVSVQAQAFQLAAVSVPRAFPTGVVSVLAQASQL